MSVLLDNDVVLKLAQLGLLADGCSLLSQEYGQLIVLDTLYYQLSGNNMKKKYGDGIIDLIKAFISTGVLKIFDRKITDSRLIELQNTHDDLDEGEMRLLQGLIDDQELLFSGDKRFIKEISKTGIIEEKKLTNRFVCIEQIICFLINRIGIELVNEKATSAFSVAEIDKALRNCIGNGRNIEHVYFSTSSYINELPSNLLSNAQHWVLHEYQSVKETID
ncbi:TPA: hypothetical protein SMP24_001502 [Proteus mirabilis]|uniref:hypothetical protein n=1 Tax=Proteus mirabilis TaxID=584 RepID=UPI000D980DA1|nr:hypothetical protein [Proteus mirabilis]ELT8663746.1 hypothetical protein [Proteus mirabilis]MBG2761133.1 hypothetical protein [Proteus mirabilis]MBG3042261.1 hypothetical protein [Proteus mirabilis]MBG3050403.1 hypothetical protein [Proteus mirabilis]MBG6013495.1 hypothetical protein [Proteus mirabilis]